jgi:HPt (histidine-containing phosphotransfer) domain-containing protein
MSGNSVLNGHSLGRDSFPVGISKPASADDGPAAIDLPSLLRRCLDDVTFCGMILHKFAARSADQLAALERALESGNTLELAREAHTLQGVAANMSAAALRSQADALERAAVRNDLPAARAALGNTRAEVTRCTQLVPELIARVIR